MSKEIQLTVSPAEAADATLLKAAVAQEIGVDLNTLTAIKILRRSIDARRRPIRMLLKVEVFINEKPGPDQDFAKDYKDVSNAAPAIVVGAGPAGLFAALKLIELGRKPIVLERGKNVKERRRDLAAINKEHVVNPESNYCFGEGGAGTYSDGKLYTRSKKRGDVQSVLETLVGHGADRDILIDAHPHIGTNKLPQIIIAMRETIINAGGEVLFNTRMDDMIIRSGAIQGVVTQNGDRIAADSLILATGHSARDIFELLDRKKILIEAKPFALGVRAEHDQLLIDKLQYKGEDRGEYLPPAAYSLVQQVNGKGVYSFCMCPGGIIAPCATAPGEVVTNGWSPSKRNNPYANSGVVVTIEPAELKEYHQHGALAGLRFQQEVERTAWIAGGKTQAVPAQRLVDFVENRTSSTIPKTSYIPGTTSAKLTDVLPRSISGRLQHGFKAFGQKMRGYYTNEAVLHGVESRTSSPVRIPRDKVTLQHPEIKGLYPCGEGAGYAGGIVSAAIDGERCAVHLSEQ